MRSKYLFPFYSRYIGLILILVHIPVVAIWRKQNTGYDMHGATSTTAPGGIFSTGHIFFIVTSLLVLIGLFLIAFSKEKIEDEQISQLRLNSLRWAIYMNYAILILSITFTNGVDFVDMLRLNLWVPLLFFIVRFRWEMFRLNRRTA
jgi:hypothetical protein